MADLLFGRNAQLFVGTPGSTGIDLSQLRFSFDIAKTNDSTANAAKIFVYNMSRKTRAFIEQEVSENFILSLSCGYNGFQRLPRLRGIFRGNITRVTHEKSGGDIVSTIECSDTIKGLSDAKINVTYKEGTPLRTLLNAAAAGIGVEVGEIQGLDGKQFLRAFSASGNARDQLDLIASRTNTDWSIQDGVLQFIAKDSSKTASILVFSPETGLLGSPNKKQDNSGVTEVQFKILLNPKIEIGQIVRLNSAFVQGEYKVQKVNFKGDTRSGPWVAEVEAR